MPVRRDCNQYKCWSSATLSNSAFKTDTSPSLATATKKRDTPSELPVEDEETGDEGKTKDKIIEAEKEAPKEAAKKIADAIKKALDPHKKVKDAIKLFKENLKLLITHLETVQEVRLLSFIFFDELDRCRPDYAIELLEGKKHLFGVPVVTFVAATNIPQLSE